MKINAFKAVAVSAFVVALGLGNVAHAEDGNIPQVQSSITTEDVGNFFSGVWNKTKNVASTVADTTVDGAKFVGRNVGEGMEKAGKGLQDISKTAEPQKTESTKISKADKVKEIEKTEVNVRKTKANTTKFEKVEPSKEAEPKVEKAEFQGVTKEDIIKTKDAVVDGIGGFLNKLRSSDTTNDNTIKPK